MDHVVTITPAPYPRTFAATCSCGDWRDQNAIKWVVLAMQRHYVEQGVLRNERGQGLVVDHIAGNGLTEPTPWAEV